MTHQKDGDPGQADVVERNGALEGILLAGTTVRIVLVPVDARSVVEEGRRQVPRHAGHSAIVAHVALVLHVGKRRADVHAAVFGQRADVVLLRFLHLVVAGEGSATERSIEMGVTVSVLP